MLSLSVVATPIKSCLNFLTWQRTGVGVGTWGGQLLPVQVMSEAPCRAPCGPQGRTERSLVTDAPGCSIWPLPSFNPKTQVFYLVLGTVARMGSVHLSGSLWPSSGRGPLLAWHACQVMSDSAIPWTVSCQAPLSMGFSRQEYWSGLPCPPPGDLPNLGIKPESLMSLAFAGGFFTTSAT